MLGTAVSLAHSVNSCAWHSAGAGGGSASCELLLLLLLLPLLLLSVLLCKSADGFLRSMGFDDASSRSCNDVCDCWVAAPATAFEILSKGTA
jgi:hypothetical protein